MAADEEELALQAAQQLHARLQLLVERTLVEAEADSFAAMDDRDGEQWRYGAKACFAIDTFTGTGKYR